jgi:hypothetical protein
MIAVMYLSEKKSAYRDEDYAKKLHGDEIA